MTKIINIVEALSILYGAGWIFFYYTGRLNYTAEKEERRRERVKKYGWLLVLAGFMCLFGGSAILIGTFLKF
jgi:hypothetical protein